MTTNTIKTEKELFSILLPYEKRISFMKLPNFDKVESLFNERKWSDDFAFGYFPVLLRDAYFVSFKNNKPFDRKDWFSYFLKTGNERQQNLKNSTNHDTFKNDWYHGRTLQCLYQYGITFKNLYKLKYGIEIKDDVAFNLMVILVLDITYLDFLKTLNTIKMLKYYFPDMNFQVSNSQDFISCGVDILVEKLDGTYVYGIYLKNDLDNQEMIEQKHHMHKYLYDCEVIVLNTSKSGRVLEDTTLFGKTLTAKKIV